MTKRSLLIMALICIYLFQTIEIKAQDIFYVKNRKAENTFNRLHQGKRIFFEQPDALIAPNNRPSFLSLNSFLFLQSIIPDYQVNADTGSSDQKYPSIAIDCSGNFMITWTDKRDGYYDIYAQYLLNDGSTAGSNVKVTDSLAIVYHYCAPSIAADSAGNFVVAWMDGRDSFKNIYMQRFSKDGIRIGNNFKVNDEEQGHSKENPSVTMDKEGNFIVTWNCSYYGNGVIDIYAQRFSCNGKSIGQTFKVSDYIMDADHEYPAITIGGKGNFIMTWHEAGCSKKVIYAQLFSNDGTPIGNNFRVNDDGIYYRHQAPDVAADDRGNFVIAWYGSGYMSSDIYAQRYNCDGTPIANNFKVNSDESAALQYYPAISMDETGNFIISWYDNRNGDYDIFAQRYLSNGSALGTNFQVTINSSELQELPDIALYDNKVYNVWQDNHSDVSGYDVWANVMLFNSPPQWISSNIVTAYEDSSFEYHASAIDPEGFAICYAFLHYPDWCTFADSIIYGTPPEGTEDTSFVVIASDGQILDTLKVAIAVIPINDPPQIINLSDFQLKNNEPYIINLDTCVNDVDNLPEDMVWKVNPVDNRLRADIVNRVAIFSAPNWTGEADVLFKVTDPEGASDSISIKVNVINPSLVREREQRIPEKFSLEQNYPNPFNPQTNITFGLPKPSEVTIDIFNLRGELVTTILAVRKEAGYHTIIWDASKFPSGTYFIKLQADDFVQIRKCVLLN